MILFAPIYGIYNQPKSSRAEEVREEFLESEAVKGPEISGG